MGCLRVDEAEPPRILNRSSRTFTSAMKPMTRPLVGNMNWNRNSFLVVSIFRFKRES